MVFLLMIVVILALVVLWNFDLHKVLAVKVRSQNAGDAAALAAARWQGLSLNLVGHLNVQEAIAIMNALTRGDGDFSEAIAIGDLEARVCFSGPMAGLAAAQSAAKLNGLYAADDFTRDLADHAYEVASVYPTRFTATPYANDPSPPTAWDDYAAMILAVASQGVAAWPANTKYYEDYASSAHLLLNPSFYDAVASSDWCWFYFNAYDELRNYRTWRDWPPLPLIVDPHPLNAEYFGLGLSRIARLDALPLFSDPLQRDEVDDLVDLLSAFAGMTISQEVAEVSAQWYYYKDDPWHAWTDLIPPGFPFSGSVKPSYNYVGADAAVLTEARADRQTPGAASHTIAWSAAAKPFGFLEGPVVPHRYGLVLPAFHDVRLIPVDTSTGSYGGSRPGWAVHIREHLPEYLSEGLSGCSPGCWYCAQLRTWEESSFRQAGIDWLSQHSRECRTSGGPGGSTSRGGTRRGH
jgi:hypothetical protein